MKSSTKRFSPNYAIALVLAGSMAAQSVMAPINAYAAMRTNEDDNADDTKQVVIDTSYRTATQRLIQSAQDAKDGIESIDKDTAASLLAEVQTESAKAQGAYDYSSTKYTNASNMVVSAEDTAKLAEAAAAQAKVDEAQKLYDEALAASKAAEEAASKLEAANTELASKKTELEDAEKVVSEKQTALDEAEKALKEAQDALAALGEDPTADEKAALDEATSALESKTQTAADAKTAYESAVSTLEGLNASLNDAKSTLASAESTLSDKQSALDSAQAALDSAQANYAKNVEVIAAEKIASAKSAYETALEASTSADAVLADAETRVTNATAALEAAKAALEANPGAYETKTVTEAYDETVIDTPAYDETIDAVVDEDGNTVTEAQTIHHDAVTHVEHHDAVTEEVWVANSDAEAAVAAARTEYDNAVAARNAASADAEAKSADAASAKVAYDDAVANAGAEAEAEATDAINAAQAKVDEASAALNAAQNIIDTYPAKIKELEGSASSAKESMDDAKTALDEANAALEEAESDYEVCKTNYEIAKDENGEFLTTEEFLQKKIDLAQADLEKAQEGRSEALAVAQVAQLKYNDAQKVVDSLTTNSDGTAVEAAYTAYDFFEYLDSTMGTNYVSKLDKALSQSGTGKNHLSEDIKGIDISAIENGVTLVEVINEYRSTKSDTGLFDYRIDLDLIKSALANCDSSYHAGWPLQHSQVFSEGEILASNSKPSNAIAMFYSERSYYKKALTNAEADGKFDTSGYKLDMDYTKDGKGLMDAYEDAVNANIGIGDYLNAVLGSYKSTGHYDWMLHTGNELNGKYTVVAGGAVVHSYSLVDLDSFWVEGQSGTSYSTAEVRDLIAKFKEDTKEKGKAELVTRLAEAEAARDAAKANWDEKQAISDAIEARVKAAQKPLITAEDQMNSYKNWVKNGSNPNSTTYLLTVEKVKSNYEKYSALYEKAKTAQAEAQAAYDSAKAAYDAASTGDTSQVDKLKADLASAQANLSTLESNLKNAQSELASTKSAFANVADALAPVTEAKTKVADATAERDSASTAVDEAKTTISGIESSITTAESDKNLKSTTLEAANAAVTTATEAKKAAQSAYDAAKADWDALTADQQKAIADANSLVATATAEKGVAEGKVTTLKSDIATLETSIPELDQARTALAAKAEAWKSALEQGAEDIVVNGAASASADADVASATTAAHESYVAKLAAISDATKAVEDAKAALVAAEADKTTTSQTLAEKLADLALAQNAYDELVELLGWNKVVEPDVTPSEPSVTPGTSDSAVMPSVPATSKTADTKGGATVTPAVADVTDGGEASVEAVAVSASETTTNFAAPAQKSSPESIKSIQSKAAVNQENTDSTLDNISLVTVGGIALAAAAVAALVAWLKYYLNR